ncbi:oligosaccharide flippase family protein [Pararhizobium haloflavum]|uniref:oligosaccharide flippase family protein n=1 Tax=Pararhizobium haloflavum TaxID=2037914 RepID=UPI000C175627|nr:polysaccharide biosynthesis C-terminal domain-containing protein [Pararhizobium haloflavum]
MTVIGIRVASAGLGLMAQILAARMVGAEGFGQYSLLLVWLMLMGHGATAGTNQVVCRFLAQYLHRGQAGEAAGLMRFVLAVVMAIAGLVAGGALLITALNPFGLNPAFQMLALMAFAAVPLLTLQDFLEGIARGMDRPELGIAPAFLLRHLALLTGMCGLFLLGMDADATHIMGLTIGGLFASVIIQYGLVARPIRARLSGARPIYAWRVWTRAALPLALVDTAQVLFLNADILVLGLFVEPELVAYYFAASRLAQILGYVPYGVTAVTAQRFAALAAPSDRAMLQTLIHQVALISTTITLGGMIFLTVSAEPLLALFGPDYVAGAVLVPLLCLGPVLICLFGPGEDVLSMLGEERVCSLAFLIALAVNVALNFTLIAWLGLVGAAIASACALAVRSALLAFFARRRLGLTLPAFFAAGAIASTINATRGTRGGT